MQYSCSAGSVEYLAQRKLEEEQRGTQHNHADQVHQQEGKTTVLMEAVSVLDAGDGSCVVAGVGALLHVSV